jgi:ABC-type branched-subunit amino acid transport system ATPase component/branched-subunit amino acid ABC-type transport system permease component
MSQHLVFLLLGLANGAVFASLALALVATHRSSGVINFATGAIALFASYQYAFFRRGQLLVLVPGLPRTVDLGVSSMGFVPAVLLSLAMTALLGLVLYLLVFRPLRAAPSVAKAVASIGIAVVLTGVMVQRLGTNPVSVAHVFPRSQWVIGDVHISQDRVWFAVTVVAIATVLGIAFRFTRFGLATRASAETEKGAFVSGLSPDRIAVANWMLSAAIAGMAGILIAPIVPLVPVAYTLFIVPALAAAIVGRFQWLGVAVAAGLAIGMLQSEAQYLVSQHHWLPSSGVPELVPLALILGVLVAWAKPLPSRGAVVQRTLGRAPRPNQLAIPTVVATTAGFVGLIALHGEWRAALITSFIFGVISLSYVVVTGFAGQVSLAQLTLAGAAGFLLGPLTTHWHVPFPIAPILAALGAAAIGVIVGLPAVRIRGLPVAVVTLALAVALEAMWFRNLDFVSSSGKPVSGPTFLGLDLRVGSGTAAYPRLGFGIVTLVVLVVVAISVARVRTSRLGSAMLAVRANERSAAAAGIDVVRTKVVAFAIGAFIAGLGGSMLAYKQTNVTFEPFTAILGLGLLATVYLAGITSVSGGILAGLLCVDGLVFKAADAWFGAADWYAVIVGVLLVVTVVLNPEGIMGPIHARLVARRNRRSIETRSADAPATPPLVVVAAPDAQPTLLSLSGITVRYGGVTAVLDVSFDVSEGSIVGLIGPNGAGKTTLIDAISGFAPHDGRIALAGRVLEGMEPHQRTRAGLGRTFQAIELYDDLTVDENVVVGLAAARGRSDDLDGAALAATFDLLGLTAVRHRPAGELSQGQRQLVSIARALAGRPTALLLDEPAGGLDSTESRWLGDRLRAIRDSGVTILLVDHDMHLVLNLCDEIRVLDFGALIASGTPADVRANAKVGAAYLGDAHATVAVSGAPTPTVAQGSQT